MRIFTLFFLVLSINSFASTYADERLDSLKQEIATQNQVDEMDRILNRLTKQQREVEEAFSSTVKVQKGIFELLLDKNENGESELVFDEERASLFCQNYDAQMESLIKDHQILKPVLNDETRRTFEFIQEIYETEKLCLEGELYLESKGNAFIRFIDKIFYSEDELNLSDSRILSFLHLQNDYLNGMAKDVSKYFKEFTKDLNHISNSLKK